MEDIKKEVMKSGVEKVEEKSVGTGVDDGIAGE